uniref:lipopolysaccharide biosynthesis protein n=1 Tax=Eubacterium cellulosolvens TaxID=29322 RepID=UPI000688A8DD|nr:oligosaccharide flippase family protein [[Eubacterium] cellulosolvens]
MSNTQSRLKQSTKNFISGSVYHVVTMLLNFVSRTVFIHTLGVEYLGLNGIFGDVLNLLSMADLGFSTAMAYSFYKPLAEKDEEKLSALICVYRKVYHVIALLIAIVGLLCVPFLKYVVHTEKEVPHLIVYYLIALAGVVSSYLFVYKSTLLTADQKDYMNVRFRTVGSLISTLLSIAGLLIWKNYILYLATGLIFGILINLRITMRANSEYPYLKKNRKRKVRDTELKKQIFENMKSVFVYKVSETFFWSTDNLIISMLVGTAAVGLYSNYLMLSSKLLLMEQIIFASMTASIGNVIASENREKRYDVFQGAQSLSFIFSGVIVCSYFLLVHDFIHVWIGEEFQLSGLLILAVSLNTYMCCVLQPLWCFRDATGMYNRIKYIMLLGALLNLVLSVILGKILGTAGVIFASAIARIATYVWYEPKLLFRIYFDRGCGRYFFSLVRNFCAVLIVMGTGWWIGNCFHAQSWLQLALKAAVTVFSMGAIFFGLYCRSDGGRMIVAKVSALAFPGKHAHAADIGEM